MFSSTWCLDSADSNSGTLGLVFKKMDRISELSDDLLHKILLLVPTKVAVSTSILSKRWEYLWMWLPKLEYGHRRCSEPESEKLQCFLERNLPLHRAPVIESFRLQMCNSRFKPESINTWVVVALSHCLRELDVLYEPYPAKPNILPSNLYTCKSLVVLKLDGGILLNVPRMVSLPSLKTLELHEVKYSKGETLQRLLSNCPILEDLVVYLRERDTTTRNLTVRLTFYIPNNYELYEYVIDTPSLKYFELVDYNDYDHYGLIENMPYLIEAYVDSSCPVLFSNQLVRLLKACSNLKRLDISLMDDHDPRQDMDDWNEPSTVPECLLSSLQSLSWSKYTGEPQERDIMGYILKHAVYLKTATIKSSESDVQKLEMIKELALSSRASKTCQLMFE
ncbi:hypothetical protein HID58_082301 [Brassica napus]|uniref:FBD domain-containing protein n=1 Tax=Brassica napus TaxID=3708 RepID=A0ABQ7YA78_BRANA|nr:hypothetical protein HID58_082301 [Brassica napus]